MRTAKISKETVKLLKENKIEEAIEIFQSNCEGHKDCEYHDSECVSMCFIPKLDFMRLRSHDLNYDQIVQKLNDHIKKDS